MFNVSMAQKKGWIATKSKKDPLSTPMELSWTSHLKVQKRVIAKAKKKTGKKPENLGEALVVLGVSRAKAFKLLEKMFSEHLPIGAAKLCAENYLKAQYDPRKKN